ncbi:MAG: hypothetical protein ACFB15_11535 [Cyclobacteriaceae bacterium]
MRFLTVIFSYLLLANLPSWGQEVVIDIPTEGLSLSTSATRLEFDRSYLPSAIENDILILEHRYILPQEKNTIDVQESPYIRTRKIICNAPMAYPHFLVRPRPTQYHSRLDIPERDNQILQKLATDLRVVY